MAKIKIAQIMGKWNGGGVESVVMNYYRNIDRNILQFDFFCDSDSTCIPYKEIEALGGTVVVIPPYQKVREYKKVLQTKLKEGDYKIIHSHISTMSVFPLYYAKKVGIPVRIAHCHSSSNKKEWKKNILKQILRPFSKMFPTDLMCCSEFAGRWLFGNKSYDKGKVYLLNNAIDAEKFVFNETNRVSIRNELEIPTAAFVMGHIGRFVAQKNHEYLIQIFNEFKKNHPDSILVLVGQGPLIDNCKNLVTQLNLTNDVKFVSQRNDVYKLYSAFDCFVLPSLYEGLPVVGVEAQCNDLPCYFSDKMTLESKILEKTQFLSISESPAYWAHKISENLNTERKNNHNILKEKGFSIVEEAKKLEDYYVAKYKNLDI